MEYITRVFDYLRGNNKNQEFKKPDGYKNLNTSSSVVKKD